MTKWLSIMLDRPIGKVIGSRPVFHDLKLNILLSGSPTQSLATFLYMIIGDFKE